jgi:hypothetical protein
MRYLLFLVLFGWDSVKAQFRFPELDKAIGSSTQYDRLKEQQIIKIKNSVKGATGSRLFNGYDKLFDEYKVFNYDSAYRYAQLQLELAPQLQQMTW